MATSVTGEQPSLTSRIVTTPLLENHPPSLRVSWILWDSPFRKTELVPGDHIIAVNDSPVTAPASLEETQRMLPRCVGQYAEDQTWQAAGARSGDLLKLTVMRRKLAGTGWRTFDVSAGLAPARPYRTADERPAMGPGGPDNMTNDGFYNGSWSAWYEKVVAKYTAILEGGWQRSLNSRYELREHLEQKARVDYLTEHYPGPFADAVKRDWEKARQALDGTTRTVTTEDLKYRQATDERTQRIRELAQQEWERIQQSLAAETVQEFPAPHPIHDDIRGLIGKYVVLPEIRSQQWIDAIGTQFFVIGGGSDGWYFACSGDPEAQRMLMARERYRKLVSPSLYDSFEFIGCIRPDPRVLIIQGRGHYGLQVQLVAALLGGAMFVDLRQAGDTAQFAGEEALWKPAGQVPPATASPADVIRALFDALKAGDLALWKLLFADWWVDYLPDGRADIHPHAIRLTGSEWEDSRRLILGKVYDLDVVWTGEPRIIYSGKQFPNAPRIEEVDVEIEHVGLFDGEYRPFVDVTVHRNWRLQRVNQGPWRIASIQSI